MADMIGEWFKNQGLQVSKSKTEMILLRDISVTGKQVTQTGAKKRKRLLTAGSAAGSTINVGKGGRRPPCIKIEGKGLRCPDRVKYLGVHIGERMSMQAHVRETGAKGRRLYGSLATVARANWGVGFQALKAIYTGVFLAITTYAAGGWGDLIRGALITTVQRNQRHALVRMSRSYSTTSTDALQVLNGEIPLDLVIKERYFKYKVRKKQPFLYGTYRYCEEHLDTVAKGRLREEILAEWQMRWDSSEKGRYTYKFFPSVRKRLMQTWIQPDYYTAQMLTGHGDFRVNLCRFQLVDTGTCECGEEDSATHVLLHCREFEEERRPLLAAFQERGITMGNEEQFLVGTSECFALFSAFARTALRKREEQRSVPIAQER